MQLLTEKQKADLPELCTTEFVPVREKVVHVKLFHPMVNWTWYVMEYDGDDTCFGLIIGHETEFGYFSLEELDRQRIFGLPIERDKYFEPTQLQDLQTFNIERVVA